MGSKSERRAVRELVSGYHETQLASLLEHVTAAIDAHRAGTLDVHDVDEVIHQYHRAARELWKFCWFGGGARTSRSSPASSTSRSATKTSTGGRAAHHASAAGASHPVGVGALNASRESAPAGCGISRL